MKMCYELCLQFEFIKPNCSCTDPSIRVVTTDQICNNNIGLDCVARMRGVFDSESISSKILIILFRYLSFCLDSISKIKMSRL